MTKLTDMEELEIAVKALDSKKAENIKAIKVADLTILEIGRAHV